MKIKRITQIFRNFWKSYSATFGFFHSATFGKVIPQLLETVINLYIQRIYIVRTNSQSFNH